MACNLQECFIERSPAIRLIGKRYDNGAHWVEWWENGWFDVLEKLCAHPLNGDSYIGAGRTVDGAFAYWIGMLFAEDTPVPEGFDSVLLPACDYAVCYVHGREDNGELFGDNARALCAKAIASLRRTVAAQGWVLERYACPRYTSPDADGCVVLDYLYELE